MCQNGYVGLCVVWLCLIVNWQASISGIGWLPHLCRQGRIPSLPSAKVDWDQQSTIQIGGKHSRCSWVEALAATSQKVEDNIPTVLSKWQMLAQDKPFGKNNFTMEQFPVKGWSVHFLVPLVAAGLMLLCFLGDTTTIMRLFAFEASRCFFTKLLCNFSHFARWVWEAFLRSFLPEKKLPEIQKAEVNVWINYSFNW